ncbi:hypothetical protein [Marinactinospora rubrisoli]|uniref:Uncharacterized protein n=1 Tax=Marinactinospora rubrisoli TaxID=2715399 RepID=A0ABW2KPV7_9ACTN
MRASTHPDCLRVAVMAAGRPSDQAAEHVRHLIAAVAAGRCPRCGDPLGRWPASSTATPDGCVPVCIACASHEEWLAEAKEPPATPDLWPLDPDKIEH